MVLFTELLVEVAGTVVPGANDDDVVVVVVVPVVTVTVGCKVVQQDKLTHLAIFVKFDDILDIGPGQCTKEKTIFIKTENCD